VNSGLRANFGDHLTTLPEGAVCDFETGVSWSLVEY